MALVKEAPNAAPLKNRPRTATVRTPCEYQVKPIIIQNRLMARKNAHDLRCFILHYGFLRFPSAVNVP